MTLEEILKSQGLTDEQVQTVVGEMKQNKIFTSSEENIDVRYKKLQGDFETQKTQYGEAQTLIEQLKADNTANEGLQQQIEAFNGKIAQLEAENAQIKAEATAKFALLDGKARAEDVDYLIYQLKKANDGKLELDDGGKIKGLDIDALKTAHPNNFEQQAQKKIEPNKLNKNTDDGSTVTKEQFRKMSYKERSELYENDRETYEKLNKE